MRDVDAELVRFHIREPTRARPKSCAPKSAYLLVFQTVAAKCGRVK